MALSITFSDINSLGEISFISGTTYILKFNVTDQSGSGVDLSSASCKWRLAPYGTSFSQLEKTGSVITTSIFEILLSSADTLNLSGKFIHQPSIEFLNGVVVKPAQGIIIIIRGIG